jgi:hypothetical protein
VSYRISEVVELILPKFRLGPADGLEFGDGACQGVANALPSEGVFVNFLKEPFELNPEELHGT